MRKCSLDEELDAATREYDYGIVPGSCTVFVRDTANNVGRLDLTLLEDVLVVIDLTDQGYMASNKAVDRLYIIMTLSVYRLLHVQLFPMQDSH